MEKDKEQLIEAYFTGTLTAVQQEQLKRLLQYDVAFAAQFDFEKEARDAVIYNERQQLKERFRTLDKQGAKPSRKLVAWWYAAASILVLIGVAWFFWDRQPEATPEKLYAQYMEPYPNMVTPQVRGDAPASGIQSEALALYDRQAYAQAALLLKQAYDEQPNDQNAFYLAICKLMLQKPEETIRLLETRSWDEAAYFSPAVVNWYLGLAYLQLGDSAQALPRFKFVAGSDDSLSNEASEIMKALGNR